MNRKNLRKPFIQTLFGTALSLAGCDPSCPPGAACNPPPPTCPQTAPAQGTDCDAHGLVCGYNECLGEPTLQAECDSSGKWAVSEVSCNPPPPITGN